MPDHVDFYLNFLQKFWRGQKVICALQNHKTITSSKLQKIQSVTINSFTNIFTRSSTEDIPMPDHVDFYLNFLQKFEEVKRWFVLYKITKQLQVLSCKNPSFTINSFTNILKRSKGDLCFTKSQNKCEF